MQKCLPGSSHKHRRPRVQSQRRTGSCGIGLGAVLIALTFHPPRPLSLALPTATLPQRA